jgi:hypothetical protein
LKTAANESFKDRRPKAKGRSATWQIENWRSLLEFLKTKKWLLGGSVFALLLVVGVFAKNGWLPSTDPLTGKWR